MVLQAAIAGGVIVLVYVIVSFLIFTPAISIFIYRRADWMVKKRFGDSIEWTGFKKVLLIIGCVLLGASITLSLIAFFFLVVLNDFSYE